MRNIRNYDMADKVTAAKQLLRIATKIASVVTIFVFMNMPVYSAAPSLSGLKDINQQLKDEHHKRSSSCFGCHTETESPAFKAIMKKECVICHKTGWVSGKLEELAKKEQVTTAADSRP